jgi:hypothetical protein
MQTLPQDPPAGHGGHAVSAPLSVHLGRAVLGITGFSAGLLFLFMVLPALALHLLASLHSLMRGVPAEPLAISISGHHLDYVFSLLSGLSFLGMAWGRRCRWAHPLGGACLAYWGLCALTSDAMRISGPQLTLDEGRAWGQVLGFALMLVLFWRFTFGRASRRYFGLLPPVPPS